MAAVRAASPVEFARIAIARAIAATARRIRLTVIVSVVLICGSFAAAALIQMRMDRVHAIDQATRFEEVRAKQIASDLAQTLDRYAGLSAAFANATETAETSAALGEAAGPALKNMVVVTRDGSLISEMKTAPVGLLPLSRAVLNQGWKGRAVALSADRRSIAVITRARNELVIAQVDPDLLMPPAGMRGALIASRSGDVLMAGRDWHTLPQAGDLLGSGSARILETADGRRLVVVLPVGGWPAIAGASVRIGEALDAWYGALPLYLFFILGPGLAGAGLAVIFVREFERRARTAEAIKNLRLTKPADARLLIRLADAERRAAEAERSKSEFVAHMSHELRTPLNAIIGFSEVIAHGIFGEAGHPKYVEYARDIGSAGRNLHTKIGDILDYADLEAGRHPITPTICDVAAIARRTVNELAGRAFSRRLKLTVSLPESARAIADPAAVRRILANLMTNALQFTPEGGAVRLQVRIEEGAIVVIIRDSGLGFSPDESVAAGEAFTRFDRPGAVTGVGMGLAIAMALARRMGGAVRVTGLAGEGASAELRLPKA